MDEGAISRLTEREKDCLRRWLDRRTAKEIALDLRVTPHAVEKRLKMARAKLGVSSSLEAARLLAEHEGYQGVGPHSPDLAPSLHKDHRPARRTWLAGGILMCLILAGALALALQPVADQNAAPRPDDGDHWTSAQQIDAVVTQNFANMDRDHSGFVEPNEVMAPTEAARRQFVAAVDSNRDGKFDLAEYRAWAGPIITKQAGNWRDFMRAGQSLRRD